MKWLLSDSRRVVPVTELLQKDMVEFGRCPTVIHGRREHGLHRVLFCIVGGGRHLFEATTTNSTETRLGREPRAGRAPWPQLVLPGSATMALGSIFRSGPRSGRQV